MTKNKYNFGVFIGRFQPFHNGHLTVVYEALRQVDKLIIVIGSANSKRTTRNPFTYDERVEMIKAGLPPQIDARIIFRAVDDFVDNDVAWVNLVKKVVKSGSIAPWQDEPYTYALCGMHKDHTSYYLNLFPEWESIAVMPTQDTLASTNIRDAIYNAMNAKAVDNQFSTEWWDFVQAMSQMPVAASDTLVEIVNDGSRHQQFVKLAVDYKTATEYQKKWGKGPFVTVDNVVFHHYGREWDQLKEEYIYEDLRVLVITRKDGGGYALPGGFVNSGETLEQAALRELNEETSIGWDMMKFRVHSDAGMYTIDDPYRDPRAHMITHVFTTVCSQEIPLIVAADDASEAQWMLYADVVKNKDQFYAGHDKIIKESAYKIGV